MAKIGLIDQGGVTREFPLSQSQAAPSSIAVGSDGNLWFTEPGANRIGRITIDGRISEFTIPTPNAIPQAIIAGSDGNLWFTELAGNKIARITVAGLITEFALPKRVGTQCGYLCPYGIASGPDGALWFSESQLNAGGGNRVGRLTTDGKLTEYEIPTLNAQPTCIVAGRDRLYVCESKAGRIAEVSLAGIVSEHVLPGAADGATPVALAAGADGKLWILVGKQYPGATGGGHEVARLTANGMFQSFDLPDSEVVGTGVAVDKSRRVWLLAGTDHIVRLKTT